MDLLCTPMKVFFFCVIIGFPAVGLKPKTIKYCCKQLLITNFLRKKPPLLKPDEEVSGGGKWHLFPSVGRKYFFLSSEEF